MIFREIKQDNCFIIQQIDNKTRNIFKSFCRHFFTSHLLPTYGATYTARYLLPTDDHYYEVQGLVFPANKSFEVLHFLLEYTLIVLILKVCTCTLHVSQTWSHWRSSLKRIGMRFTMYIWERIFKFNSTISNCLDMHVPVYEGPIGVLLWCVISWFYLPYNRNLENYFSWLVIWRFCVTREELESLSDILDLIALFSVILRRSD